VDRPHDFIGVGRQEAEQQVLPVLAARLVSERLPLSRGAARPGPRPPDAGEGEQRPVGDEGEAAGRFS
jgi:hypothetical protein